MRKFIAFAITVSMLVAGCATDSSSAREDNLRKREYLRTERTWTMTFPEIQQALFKHERECGNAPIFRMKEGETSFAYITEPEDNDRPWNQTILVDLMWLQPSIRQETRTRLQVYSFYSDAEVKRRIQNIFDAINKPGECRS